MNAGHRHEADRAIPGHRGHQEKEDGPRTDRSRGEQREDGSSAAHGGAHASLPHRDLSGRDGPLGAILGVSKPDESSVRDHRQEAQGTDGTNHNEAVAEEGEDGREPLILMALRGLVELLSGQDAAGHSDRRAGGQVAPQDIGAVKGTPISVGNTDRREAQVDSQHRAQSGDRGPFRSSEIRGTIGVDNGHGHHGGAHETSDRRETTVPSVMH